MYEKDNTEDFDVIMKNEREREFERLENLNYKRKKMSRKERIKLNICEAHEHEKEGAYLASLLGDDTTEDASNEILYKQNAEKEYNKNWEEYKQFLNEQNEEENAAYWKKEEKIKKKKKIYLESKIEKKLKRIEIIINYIRDVLNKLK